ncbi:MAG: type II toxin-antitoxin system HipA family toxin, partial [Bacteroidales bacterium]|nr:type II toxin-antitoxin system HipA family toxin [Bacteroidales bacterium]
RGEHATSVRYVGNPSREDMTAAGTGIRIPRKRCIEIIDEIMSICKAELDEKNL